jgi:predicted Zn-dependent peptidase
MDAATPASVLGAAKKWITQGDYTLLVKPGTANPQEDVAETAGLPTADGKPAPVPPAAHEYKTVKSDIDRNAGVPHVAAFPDLNFPTLQHGKLKNGIEVVLAERHAVPLVEIKLLFGGGYAADFGRKLGTASFTAGMLDEGTTSLDSLEIARRRERLGASLGTGCDLDNCSVALNSLKSQLVPSLALFADVVRHPAFRDEDIGRIRGQWLAGIAQEKTEPTGLALRTLPPLVYGKGSAYAIPFTGSGDEASIKALSADDMRAFVRDFLRPDNTKIIIAGDTVLADIVAQLDAVFGDWQAPTQPVPKVTLSDAAMQKSARVFLMDRPGSQQSMILAGLPAPSTMAPDNLQINTMEEAFGGLFTSRLNMNLREDKHWAYGAFAFSPSAVGQRLFLLYAPVQTDKTAPALAELLKESHDLIGPKPLTTEEIAKVKSGNVRAMPGEYESADAVLRAVQQIVVYHRPDDYVQTYKRRVEAQTDAEVNAAAKEVVRPDALTWVIIGDRAQIEKPVQALKIGTLQVLDADGNVTK